MQVETFFTSKFNQCKEDLTRLTGQQRLVCGLFAPLHSVAKTCLWYSSLPQLFHWQKICCAESNTKAAKGFK
jgi:hypothetical protein